MIILDMEPFSCIELLDEDTCCIEGIPENGYDFA